ncbi:Shr3 amino acid permease chaperone [Kockovaella imperatae]|uniref:Shr3 amino acid permease chaperone n=1 Tax=Kockovaella imperatae TaxID=4999 RepID=A0A1Y1UC08_9TREE|nr:Shr3 amino acid permease chaperone [Kockovaella imperatae]ORX35064.1 Shr3 amino acid permease chaperone [Kockovaella imperatae]
MTFAQSVVLGSCAFILGMVFVCQVVDIPLLYMPVTKQSIENGYTFYEMWFESPGAVKALFHVALGLPLIALIVKLHGWTESAMFFDGSSLALHVAVIILYLTVHIPSLRTFLPESSTVTSFSILPPPPPRDTPPTEAERIEALRVLCAGNALVGVVTVGIIIMQLGQEYARRQEEKEQREIDLRSKKDI